MSIVTKGDWFNHLEKLELTLKSHKDNGLKCYIAKSLFGQTEMEYLGLWVTWSWILPINKKVESILNMMPTKNTKELRAFIGMIIYDRDMWSRQSHLLHPLTKMTSNKVKF